MTKLSLVVIQNGKEAKEIPIRLSQFLIGRDPQCHLRPASTLISKRHCAFIVKDDKAILRDFDSLNGTILNENPLKGEAELKHGDIAEVGPLKFRIKLVQTAPAPTPKPAPPKKEFTEKKVYTDGKGSTSESEDDSEDMFGDLLMTLKDEDVPPDTQFLGEDPISAGSTVHHLDAIDETSTDQPAAKDADGGEDEEEESEKVKAHEESTADAAKAILDKYMKRPK